MADTISPATYEQIATLLTQLHTSYSNIAGVFYDIFYNPVPKNVTFKMFDESGSLKEFTVKNLSLSNQYRKLGRGIPQESAPIGTIYQSLDSGNLYTNKTGTDDGWFKLIDGNQLENYIRHGMGNPNGVETAGVGTLFIDTNEVVMYMCTNSEEKTWDVIPFSFSNYAYKDFSNISAAAENKIKEVVAEGIDERLVDGISSSSSANQIPSAMAVYEYVNPQVNSKQDKSNLVTSISSSSTDTQYPSAKCVYDLIGNLADTINNL